MGRPSKDDRIIAVNVAASITGLLRHINQDLLPRTTDEQKRKSLTAHRDHLVHLYNKLTSPDATVRPKQHGSRLLPYECDKPTGGCGYKVRVTGIWVNVAEPICPNPDCEKFRQSMTSMGQFYRSRVVDLETVEQALRDDKEHQKYRKEHTDWVESFMTPEQIADNENFLKGKGR